MQIQKVIGDLIEKDISFEEEPPFGARIISIPEKLYGDNTKLTQVLLNLIGNAIKFTDSGKSVVVKAGMENENLILSVIDQGIGIDEKNIEGGPNIEYELVFGKSISNDPNFDGLQIDPIKAVNLDDDTAKLLIKVLSISIIFSQFIFVTNLYVI